jgi:mono/diheme cytochrome c family protein
LLIAVAGCDRAPPVDGLKPWTAADHDGEQRASRAASKPAAGDADAGNSMAMLVDAAWKNQCQSCHGAAGHGDGPQGPMYKAADLAREEWQSKITDAEMTATILNGKGKMPKFNIPAELVGGLVGRVRSFRGH